MGSFQLASPSTSMRVTAFFWVPLRDLQAALSAWGCIMRRRTKRTSSHTDMERGSRGCRWPECSLPVTDTVEPAAAAPAAACCQLQRSHTIHWLRQPLGFPKEQHATEEHLLSRWTKEAARAKAWGGGLSGWLAVLRAGTAVDASPPHAPVGSSHRLDYRWAPAGLAQVHEARTLNVPVTCTFLPNTESAFPPGPLTTLPTM